MTRLSSTARGAALVFLVALFYLPAFFGGFVWDDDGHVTGNETLHSPDGLRRIWLEPGATQQYYPLVYTSFWLEYRAWGDNPRGYHAVNVLLHCLVTVALWTILRRLGVPGAWFAAAVFGLHPVHVESVAWISERKNVLAAVFYLASALTYLRFEGVSSSATPPGPSAVRDPLVYLGSFALFVAALFSKTVTCSLPVALLLVLWWKLGKVSVRRWLPLVPFFAVGLVLGLTTVWIEKHHIGAVGESFDRSVVDRCLIAGRAFWFYLSKLVWPASLAFIYPRFRIDSGEIAQYFFPVSAIAFLLTLWLLRARIGRGPFTALAFFGVTLVPALGFFNVFPMKYSFVADHFQYLASIGPIALIVAAASIGATRRGMRPMLVAMVAGLALFAVGILTWQRARLFQDAEFLWRDTIHKSPAAEIAYTNLGTLLLDRGRAVEAIPLFRAAITLDPDSGDGETNLGSALMQLGRSDEAVEQYEAVLRKKPDHPVAQYNLGVVLSDLGKLDAAIDHLTQAIDLDPGSPSAHHYLAVALARQRKWGPAIEADRAAIRLHARYTEAYIELANSCSQAGRSDEAVNAFRDLLALDPAIFEARFKLAQLRAARGETDEAIREFEEAARLRPELTEPRVGLARALCRAGRAGDAADALKAALVQDPNEMALLEQLAWILATHPSDAVRRGSEALELAAKAVELTSSLRPESLQVLAAAQAEQGQFDDALRTADKGFELARFAGNAPVAEAIKTQRDSYRSHLPWRNAACRE